MLVVASFEKDLRNGTLQRRRRRRHRCRWLTFYTVACTCVLQWRKWRSAVACGLSHFFEPRRKKNKTKPKIESSNQIDERRDPAVARSLLERLKSPGRRRRKAGIVAFPISDSKPGVSLYDRDPKDSNR